MIKDILKKETAEPKEYQVTIPEEKFSISSWEEENLPLICMVNTSLKDFEPKEVFSWHLSLIIDFEELIENGMPSEDERLIVDPFCDKLDEEIKAGGNALFLLRETWNKTRRLVWRVYDPEIADQHLKYILEYKQYPREFDYYMEQDLNWDNANWYLNEISSDQ